MITKHKEQYIRTKQKYPKDLEKISNVSSFKADHAFLLLAHCPTPCIVLPIQRNITQPIGYIRIHSIWIHSDIYSSSCAASDMHMGKHGFPGPSNFSFSICWGNMPEFTQYVWVHTFEYIGICYSEAGIIQYIGF